MKLPEYMGYEKQMEEGLEREFPPMDEIDPYALGHANGTAQNFRRDEFGEDFGKVRGRQVLRSRALRSIIMARGKHRHDAAFHALVQRRRDLGLLGNSRPMREIGGEYFDEVVDDGPVLG